MLQVEVIWSRKFGHGYMGPGMQRSVGQFGWKIIYRLPRFLRGQFGHTTPLSGLRALKRKAQGSE